MMAMRLVIVRAVAGNDVSPSKGRYGPYWGAHSNPRSEPQLLKRLAIACSTSASEIDRSVGGSIRL